MIAHENRLLADVPYFCRKLGRISQYLSSAAVVIGALRVKLLKWSGIQVSMTRECQNQPMAALGKDSNNALGQKQQPLSTSAKLERTLREKLKTKAQHKINIVTLQRRADSCCANLCSLKYYKSPVVFIDHYSKQYRGK